MSRHDQARPHVAPAGPDGRQLRRQVGHEDTSHPEEGDGSPPQRAGSTPPKPLTLSEDAKRRVLAGIPEPTPEVRAQHEAEWLERAKDVIVRYQ